MRRSPRTCLLLLGGSLLLLFLFRFFYGYIDYPADRGQVEQVLGQSSFSYTGNNYASTKGAKGGKAGAGTPMPVSVDQKYERIGTLTMKSDKYAEDEATIRNSVTEVGGLIQFEQRSGLEGGRSLHLAIGVVPEKFESLVATLREIGKLTSIRIDKTDKTNEYRTLQAKQKSLAATKESLVALKQLGSGSIEELMKLESEISQVESQIQDLGVSLGDYDAENEFCTVKCSLLEMKVVKAGGIGIPQRIKVALEWTVGIYLRLVFILAVGTSALWALLLGIHLARKWLPALMERFGKAA